MKKTFLVLFSLSFFFVIPKIVLAVDIYDVILFWGQSNMVGRSGNESYKCSGESPMVHKDSNLENLGVETFASKTGISSEIVNKYKTIGHVDVPLTENTVYDYSYLENKLIPLTKDTVNVGEVIYVHKNDSNTLTFNNESTDGHLCLEISSGTNMIPWYGKTHYEKTGHKVIAVFAANGGEDLNHFLPHNDSATGTSIDGTNNNGYLYEGMVEKYKAAIQYLKNNNYNIGYRIDIVMQGENDARLASESEPKSTSWDKMYKNIHNNLKEDLGIDFSVVVGTSRKAGSEYYDGAELINKAQKKVCVENDDVILGSTFTYDHFVGPESIYSGKYMGKTMSYSDAVELANMITARQCNNDHYHSATLSQIGLESAVNVAKFMLIKKYENKNLLRSLKINGKSINLSDTKTTYTYEVSNETKNASIEATIVDDKFSFVQGYGSRKTNLEVGENNVEIKVQYDDEIRTYNIVITRKDASKLSITNPKTGSYLIYFFAFLLLSVAIIIIFKRKEIKENINE